MTFAKTIGLTLFVLLGLWLAGEVKADEQYQTAIPDALIDSRSKGALKQLLSDEISRLRVMGRSDRPIEMKQISEIQKKIASVQKAGVAVSSDTIEEVLRTGSPAISRSEQAKILSWYRIQQVREKGDTREDVPILVEMSNRTIDRLDAKSKEKRPKLSHELNEELVQQYQSLFPEKQIADKRAKRLNLAEVREILGNKGFKPSSVSALMELNGILGAVEYQARYRDYLDRTKDEMAKLFREKLRESMKGELPVRPGFLRTLSGKEPEERIFRLSIAAPQTGADADPVEPSVIIQNFGRGFGGGGTASSDSLFSPGNSDGRHRNGSPGGGSSSRSVRFSPLEGGPEFDSKITSEVNRLRAAGGYALSIETEYGNPNQYSACQGTLVSRKPVIGSKVSVMNPFSGQREVRELCEHAMASAIHCFYQDENLDNLNPNTRATKLRVYPLGEFQANEFVVARGAAGRDMALAFFVAPCTSQEELPVVPIAGRDIAPGEKLAVQTRAVLACQNRDVLVDKPGFNLIDCRSPINGGVGIEPGDSGGPAIAFDQNGQPTLAGVISMKLMSFPGVGLLAGQGEMADAKALAEGAFPANQIARRNSYNLIAKARTH